MVGGAEGAIVGDRDGAGETVGALEVEGAWEGAAETVGTRAVGYGVGAGVGLVVDLGR